MMEEKEHEKTEEQIPFCTTAPSAEHARAFDDDDVCNDFRAGVPSLAEDTEGD